MYNARERLLHLTKADFKIDTFRAGGKGGQSQNTTDSGVRITHIESGVSAESREERSQKQNKKVAFVRLTKKPAFLRWVYAQIRIVDAMREENIITQVYIDDEWIEIDPKDLRS